MKKIVIDKPTLADTKALSLLGKNIPALLWSDEDQWLTQKEFKKLITREGNSILRVARIDGVCVGICIAYDLVNWGMISELFIAQEYQNQKIGILLLKHVVKELKKRGIKTYALTVKSDNENAKRFYKRHNFTQGYTMEWWYTNKVT